MCGRFVRARTAKEFADPVNAVIADEGLMLPFSWNVAPTDPVLIVVERDTAAATRRELHSARWGLVPSWTKDPNGGAKTINARIETVAEKPTYTNSVRSKRCLVAADGYYEWQRLADRKQPFYIYPADNGPMYFAGLYSWWANSAFESGHPDRWMLTASIVTSAAVGKWAEIHERMPVALTSEGREAWLAAISPTEVPDLLQLVRADAQKAAAGWICRKVGTAVGSVRNNGPELLQEVSE